MLDQPQRGRATAIAAAPNFMVRLVLRNPKDFVAGMIAFAAISAVVANAMLLQAGRHPSPMFGAGEFAPSFSPAIPNVLPRPRPIDAAPAGEKPLDSRMLDSKPVQLKAIPKPAEPKPAEPKPADHRASDLKPSDLKGVDLAMDAKPDSRGIKSDRLATLVRASAPAPAASSSVPRPPAPITGRTDPLADLITSSYRVAWVQRALSEHGAGQLKATGTLGPETQAAIARFERERKLPVTGQLSDRLLRELAIATGRPLG